jgi:hypothetical protein
MDLPCSPDHWAADSPQAWASLTPWTTALPRGPSLRQYVRSLKTPSDHPADESPDQHRRLITVYLLLRNMYSLSELHTNPISSLGQSFNELQQCRLNVLSTLRQLVEPLSNHAVSQTLTEFADLVHNNQIIHMAIVYGLGLMSTWLYSLLRMDTRAAAKGRLKQWSMEEPARVRQVVYHCAQTLSIVRVHPYNLHFEAFNAFHAGLILWSMIDLLPAGQDGSPTRGVCVDQLHGEDPAADAEVSEWIHRGEPRTISLHSIPDLQGTGSRRQVLDQTARILRRMRVPGLAKCFLNVVLDMLRHEEG